MSVAWELECETFRPRLYVVPDHSELTAPAFPVRRRQVVVLLAVAAAAVALLVLLALPVRSLGGSTLAQAAPAQGQEYVVKAGDTLGSIAHQADPSRTVALAGQLARETGSTVLVPGEHIFIP